MTGKLRIGPAGWSYKDWEGIVYPAGLPGDRLSFLAGIFDTIEINNTFYRIPDARETESWARRIERFSSFKFTLKINRLFTHAAEGWQASHLKALLEGISPLAKAGCLGAVLVQYPWSIRYSDKQLSAVLGLAERLTDHSCVLEFRHASWEREEVFQALRRIGAGWCNIDQPGLRDCLGVTSIATSPTGYVRLHGRNAADWFREGAGRDARYDYLYSEGQLERWSGIIRDLSTLADDVFIVCNNHFRGKAVCNGLQLMGMLTGEKAEVPSCLAEEFPELEKYTEQSGPVQLRLF